MITESDIFIIFDILGGVSAVENQQDSGQIVILSPGQQKKKLPKKKMIVIQMIARQNIYPYVRLMY